VAGEQLRTVFENVVLVEYRCRYDCRDRKVNGPAWTTLRVAHTHHRIEADGAYTTPHARSLTVWLALAPAAMVRICGRRDLMGAMHLPAREEAMAEPAFVLDPS
jgi:hypothetical protein